MFAYLACWSQKVKKEQKNSESANDRTINLFRPEVKRSLQMNGVRDCNTCSFGLHRKGIGQEFRFICQLIGRKLKLVAVLLITKTKWFSFSLS